MTAGEVKAVLDKVIAKAEEREDNEYASDESLDINGGCWARIVRLMNLCTACRDVQKLLDKCKLADEEF